MLNRWEVLSPLLGVRKNSGFDQQAVECILCVLYCINTSELCYKCEQTQSTPFRPVKISRTSHTASYLWVMICPAELCLTLRQVLLEDSMFRFFCLELRGQRNWIRLREDPCGCLNHEITHLTVRNSRHFGLLVGRWMGVLVLGYKYISESLQLDARSEFSGRGRSDRCIPTCKR